MLQTRSDAPRAWLATAVLISVLSTGAALSGVKAHAQGAAYRVYPAPVESPLRTTPLPPADARILVADPASAEASPFGWHDTDGVAGPESTTTQGNNALVFFDADGDGVPDPGELADGGPALAFDFPIDLMEPPPTYAAAVVTNLFYWANYVHDVLYHYGFDEEAGNFQATNYGGGGGGGDAVTVRLVEGGSFNAHMQTPPEGSSPRLTLTLPASGSSQYPEFNNGLFVHELTHGLTMRLTGSPATVSCLDNPEQMGEGWSDWYALMLTQRSGDTRTDPRTGPFTRPAPYTTDFAANDFTHGDVATVSVPSGVGFVWATALWEVTWDLVDAFGFSPDLTGDGTAGNEIALRLVTEGLKRQPCAPGFVDGRDAILAADSALYGAAHADVLWAAFARRGLGFSADQGSSNSTTDNTEAFDLPPTTEGEPGVAPSDVALEAVAPNPVVGEVRVTYALAVPGPVRLAVYDVRGREVAVGAEGLRAAGRHTLRLDTRGWPAGAYALRLDAGGEVRSRLVTVVR